MRTVTSRPLDLYLATDHVVGQERARRQLSIMLHRQIGVAEGSWARSDSALIFGRTGVGKTYLAKMMAERCGLPFADTNLTQYTESGYAGDDLAQMFLPLLEAAARQYDALFGLPAPRTPSVLKREDISVIAQRASTGVVLLDEFDKWTHRINHSTGRLDTAIQAEFLKMVEGSVVYISDNDDEVGIPFDTSKVLILCAGAFVGLIDKVLRRLDRPIEFSDNEAFWFHVEQQDFVRYGLIPELAGRLGKLIFLRPLQKDDLAKIILRPGGPIDELRLRFEDAGCDWRVPEVAIVHLADRALQKQVGARGIDSVLWAVFSEALFQASVAEYPTAVRLAVNQVKAEVVAA